MEVGCITPFSAGRGARETLLLLLLLLLRPDVSLNWLLSEGHGGRCKSCKGPAQEQGTPHIIDAPSSLRQEATTNSNITPGVVEAERRRRQPPCLSEAERRVLTDRNKDRHGLSRWGTREMYGGPDRPEQEELSEAGLDIRKFVPNSLHSAVFSSKQTFSLQLKSWAGFVKHAEELMFK
ncbi:hypothetical protein EYF80_015541 [Liparis tanakae]|uniref:Uncharacterized protein n=1 Tax=Liparis tanakae TaxID=230148 RepID=A0A4Z2I8L2_9TELE|nr:hypothetical protein EYF80_015541 [Liparis tanakae]